MKTIITALALSAAAAGCSDGPAAPSALIPTTQSVPSPPPPTPAPPTAPAPPPQPKGGGLISGHYDESDFSFFTPRPLISSCHLDLEQDGSSVTGHCSILLEGDTPLTGTFDPLAGDPGTFGRLTLAIQGFEAHIEANVITPDGSTFAGQAGACGDRTCTTYQPDSPRYPVTYVRTGPYKP